jgi:hypothetical protein
MKNFMKIAFIFTILVGSCDVLSASSPPIYDGDEVTIKTFESAEISGCENVFQFETIIAPIAAFDYFVGITNTFDEADEAFNVAYMHDPDVGKYAQLNTFTSNTETKAYIKKERATIRML